MGPLPRVRDGWRHRRGFSRILHCETPHALVTGLACAASGKHGNYAQARPRQRRLRYRLGPGGFLPGAGAGCTGCGLSEGHWIRGSDGGGYGRLRTRRTDEIGHATGVSKAHNNGSRLVTVGPAFGYSAFREPRLERTQPLIGRMGRTRYRNRVAQWPDR
ncbi:hypothetical protein PSAC2689_100154 [Paraburkholderia sacchari]